MTLDRVFPNRRAESQHGNCAPASTIDAPSALDTERVALVAANDAEGQARAALAHRAPVAGHTVKTSIDPIKIAVGEHVRLRVTMATGRCVMTTLPQGDLPKDSGILRTAAQHNNAEVGVYAEVIAGGPVRRGDPITVL